MADNQSQRDWHLIKVAPAVMNTVSGLAYATAVVLKGRDMEANKRSIELAKEMVSRFVDSATNLQMLGFEYRPDMTEDELRAWAADAHRVITTGQPL